MRPNDIKFIAQKAYDAFVATKPHSTVGDSKPVIPKFFELSEQDQKPWVEAAKAAVSSTPAPICVEARISFPTLHMGLPVSRQFYGDFSPRGVKEMANEFSSYVGRLCIDHDFDSWEKAPKMDPEELQNSQKEAIKELLRLSWRDIAYEYKGLTKMEKETIDKDMFKSLVEWIGEDT